MKTNYAEQAHITSNNGALLGRRPKSYGMFVPRLDSTPHTIAADGFPFAPPKWPDARSYADIILLHAFNSPEAALNNQCVSYDFAVELNENATVIDIGAGQGRLISELREKAPNFNLIAVSATPLNDALVKNADHIYYQYVPDHSRLLEDYAGKADFVIDTFGAGTYATNPLHALVYSILLLAPGGMYSCISSLVPGHEDYSAFGDKSTQKEIINFLREELGLELSIEPTYLQSKVKPGLIVQDLLIRCERPNTCQQAYTLKHYNDICKKIDKLVGTPECLGAWDNANYGNFQIRWLKYNKPPTNEYEKDFIRKPESSSPTI